MIIDANYYFSVLQSFDDMIDEAIFYGTDIGAVRKAAKAMSQGNDHLVVYGNVNDCATDAYFDGKALKVAYDSDMEAHFYIIKNRAVYKLVEKSTGGFYLVEQRFTSPIILG